MECAHIVFFQANIAAKKSLEESLQQKEHEVETLQQSIQALESSVEKQEARSEGLMQTINKLRNDSEVCFEFHKTTQHTTPHRN